MSSSAMGYEKVKQIAAQTSHSQYEPARHRRSSATPLSAETRFPDIPGLEAIITTLFAVVVGRWQRKAH